MKDNPKEKKAFRGQGTAGEMTLKGQKAKLIIPFRGQGTPAALGPKGGSR